MSRLSQSENYLASHPDTPWMPQISLHLHPHMDYSRLVEEQTSTSIRFSGELNRTENTNQLRRSGFQHFDSLDKALTVFKMNDRPDRVHRRVDLIFAPWKIYWTAVVGWCACTTLSFQSPDCETPDNVYSRTGSTQFERDIRKWSKSHW